MSIHSIGKACSCYLYALKTWLIGILVVISVSGCASNVRWEWFDDHNVNKLCKYARVGDVQKIDELIAMGADVNARGEGNVTPLLCMLYSRNKTGFKRLLEHGADPNVKMTTDSGISVMLYLVTDIDDVSMLRLALKHGGNPNMTLGLKSTSPIVNFAIIDGRDDAIEELIQAGLDVNSTSTTDGFRHTPLLYFATSFNRYKIALMLLKAGADPTLDAGRGKTVLNTTIKRSLKRMDRDSDRYPWLLKTIDYLENDLGHVVEEYW
jgi:ankyrin repeat protein